MTVGAWSGWVRRRVPGLAGRGGEVRPGGAVGILWVVLAVFGGGVQAGARAAGGAHPGAGTHPWPGGRLEVSVPADESMVAGSVEVVLMEGDLPVARLTTRRLAPLLESHLTDLDGDRAQELLLVYGKPGHTVEVWEWQAKRHAFARLVLPPIESDVPLLDGRFRLDGGTLTYTARRAAGNDDPMTWNYDGEDARWERRRRFWPW